MDQRPKNLIPAWVSLGFGLDADACMFLSNWSAKIINGSPTEETPRERPLLGRDQIRDVLENRIDLQGKPVVVRDDEARQLAEELISGFNRPLLTTELLERAVLDVRSPPPDLFAVGEERRATPRCESSVDEARTVAGIVFYALNGLTERERIQAVARATANGRADL